MACLNLMDIKPRYEPGDRTRQFTLILQDLWFVIVFNFYLRKIVLQEVEGEIIFKRELIWNEWFIFIFIDIYNN